MAIRSFVRSRLTEYYFGRRRLTSRRAAAERTRRAEGRPHLVHWFHQADDPHSHVLALVLPRLLERYDIVVQPHLAAPPPDWAAPDRERLISWGREDAAHLARAVGLAFTDPGRHPDPDAVHAANAALAGITDPGSFVERAIETGERLWSGQPISPAGHEIDPAPVLAGNAALRERLGHYLGATLYYEGEWYWGLDRLHYLETRLAELGARRSGAPEVPIHSPPPVPRDVPGPAEGPMPDLHFYLSFRSPYTYIATARAKALADAYGARLRLRFVLPMVMRGLPVPRMKSFYITSDVAREAHRLGLPFGRICDPLGKPVERGYSLLPWAIAQGRGYEYVQAFLAGVWSRGLDAGSDGGLRRIVETAGLDWREARDLVGNDDWRGEAEANRAELTARGLWGVPSFRVGDTALWGQDRLWLIESELAAARARHPSAH